MARRRGFTLIELLVVIAIIAILISILMPMLSRARDLARTAACVSSLRTCAVSLNLYAAEFREYPQEGLPGSSDGGWHIAKMIELKMLERDNWKCTGTSSETGFWAPFSPVPAGYRNRRDYSVFMYRGPYGGTAPEFVFAPGQIPGNTGYDYYFGSVATVNWMLAGYLGYVYNERTCPSYRNPQQRMTQMACPSARYFGMSIYAMPRSAATLATIYYGEPIPGNVTSYTAVHNGLTSENFYWSDGAVQTARYEPGDYYIRQQARDKRVFAWAGIR